MAEIKPSGIYVKYERPPAEFSGGVLSIRKDWRENLSRGRDSYMPAFNDGTSVFSYRSYIDASYTEGGVTYEVVFGMHDPPLLWAGEYYAYLWGKAEKTLIVFRPQVAPNRQARRMAAGSGETQ